MLFYRVREFQGSSLWDPFYRAFKRDLEGACKMCYRVG